MNVYHPGVIIEHPFNGVSKIILNHQFKITGVI